MVAAAWCRKRNPRRRMLRCPSSKLSAGSVRPTLQPCRDARAALAALCAVAQSLAPPTHHTPDAEHFMPEAVKTVRAIALHVPKTGGSTVTGFANCSTVGAAGQRHRPRHDGRHGCADRHGSPST